MIIMFLTFFLSFSSTSHAYIGPGLPASTLTILLGFASSILLALFAVIWFPVKAFLKKTGKQKTPPNLQK